MLVFSQLCNHVKTDFYEVGWICGFGYSTRICT